MTVVEVRSYSLISGSTSALRLTGIPGAWIAASSAMRRSWISLRVGVQKADRDRLDPRRAQPDQRVDRGGLVERLLHRARGIDPLVDLTAQIALDQGRRLGPGEVVEPRHAQGADLQNVAKPACGDQPGAGALALRIALEATVVPCSSSASASMGRPARATSAGKPIDDRLGIVMRRR